jgi:murein DD-endopeptidase MepM/ murein hydrolase activator NlpD
MRLPVDNYVITSGYGERILHGKKEFHDGIDFKSKTDNKVVAVCNCVCSYDMDNYNEALRWVDRHHSGGNMIIIDFQLKNTLFHMRYLHLIENIISAGQKLKEGDLIGHYGDVGYSFGAHLHNDLYMTTTGGWIKINIENFYKNCNLL